MMINEPTADTAGGAIRCDKARPDVIAPAVPAIVSVAITTFGGIAIRVSRMPRATPTARLSRFDTAAISTAESKSTTQRYVLATS
jgi:hypothetical protein